MRLSLKVVDMPPMETSEEAPLGVALVELVQRAVQRGGAPPAALVLRPERTELMTLQPVVGAGVPVQRFMAGLTRSTCREVSDVGAVALIGVMSTTPDGSVGPPVPLAVVFVEWPDCRWWFWRGVVDVENKTVKPGSEVVISAMDGDRMPDRLGRWWSLGRRLGLRVTMERVTPEWVH